MGYLETSLLPGETIVARAHLHWMVFAKAIGVALVGVALAWFEWRATAALLVLAALLAIGPAIAYASSEFGVTSKRVVIKVGVVQRRTLELLLRQVEAISVDQGLAGRVFDYGTITLSGTGGVREIFHDIAAPLEFRRHIQSQTLVSS